MTTDNIDQCGQHIWPHVCKLFNCPRDDPDHMHICFADDFDWRDGDFVQLRLGRIELSEFLRRGFLQVLQRLFGDEAHPMSRPFTEVAESRTREWLAQVAENEKVGVHIKITKDGIGAVDNLGDPAYTDDMEPPSRRCS